MGYLSGQDGWRHLITKTGLRRGLGLGATSALCYGVAAQHWVYILIGGGRQNNKEEKCKTV